MYLKQVVIENSGPLRRIDLDLAFNDDGSPKPLILVGANGGGKTNLLSLVTDALFEAAATYYEDVLPARGLGRAWFRVVGGITTTVGTPGGFSLLKFDHHDQHLTYKEKAGNVDPAEAAQRVPGDLAGQINWPAEGSFKEFSVSEETSRQVFEGGVYAYFPSSRSEVPYWLNRESIPETEFELGPRFAKRLKKPIFIERSLHDFKQWIISIMLESRADIGVDMGPPAQLQIQGNVGDTFLAMAVLQLANTLLRRVLDDEDVRLVWIGRKSPDKVAVARGGELILPNLDALSSGQSTLLGMFGTLLRYGDQSLAGHALNLPTFEGICVVDEIDSHIHVDLQHKILPSLIKLFPRIQFVLSSHSPLFVLGMEKEFGSEGFQLIEMPGGKAVTAETYSEFGKAMEALTATEAFNEKLLSEASQTGVPIVFVEGETDTPYLRRAADVLERAQILERCDIQWIGAKADNGQAFHTGKPALNHTLQVLQANPKLAIRPILLLYDNDANKADVDYDSVSVRSLPSNEANKKVQAGIENLLPESAITEDDYHIIDDVKPNGDILNLRTVRKVELCQRICETGSKEDFGAFGTALDVIEAYLDAVAPVVSNEVQGAPAEA